MTLIKLYIFFPQRIFVLQIAGISNIRINVDTGVKDVTPSKDTDGVYLLKDLKEDGKDTPKDITAYPSLI